MKLISKKLLLLLIPLFLFLPAMRGTAAEATAVPETEGEQTELLPMNDLLNGPDIYGETYCVIDGDTGEVLLSKDMDGRRYPASTTKMMTALLVLENVPDLNVTLTFTETAINIDPSSSTLTPKACVGEIMTVKDALYGMLLQSANECGAMLGEFVAGSEAAFAEMMNARAAAIGCRNTHFMNAYGIHHDEHYTTAYDLALILRECMKNERYRELNATVNYTIPATNMNAARYFEIGHLMIRGTVAEEGVIGGKTGSTPQAGRCLATACRRNGRYLITTVMKSSKEYYYEDTSVLLEYAYGIYQDHTMAPVNWVETNDTVAPTESVRIRYSPSLRGGVYGLASADQTYLRRAVYGDWAMVQCDGGLYYILNSYLQTYEPEKVPDTTAYSYEEPVSETETETESETEKETTGETPEATTTRKAEETTTRRGSVELESSTAEEEIRERGEAGQVLVYVFPAVLILSLVTLWIIVLVNHAGNVKRNRKIKN